MATSSLTASCRIISQLLIDIEAAARYNKRGEDRRRERLYFFYFLYTSFGLQMIAANRKRGFLQQGK
jgi:hypothetical protein